MCGFWMQKSAFWRRITSIDGSQTLPVVLCMQNSAWVAPQLLDSMGSSPNLWFCAFKTATLGPKFTCLYGSQTSSSRFSACKTAWSLASELVVSMGSSPHLWFLHAKQRILDQNNTVSVVPRDHLSFCACNTAVISTRITCLCRSQPLSVVFAMQNRDFWRRITSLYGSQTLPVVLCMQKSVSSIRITRLYGFQP